MKIAYIAAGAANMYCGSCLRDNALAAALVGAGHDCLLIPTYTPVRTDEANVSLGRVFYGGINVFLDQKWNIFQRLPAFVRRWIDRPGLLRWVSKFSDMTAPGDVGALTVSVLQGEDGRQNLELAQLVKWLADEVKPDIVNLPNAMFLGLARRLKEALGVPVVCALSGEDLFLESLSEPWKSRSIALIRKRAVDCDGFLATSRYYADFMAGYMDCPRSKVHVVPLGLNPKGHGGERPPRHAQPTVGYFARICPAKGLHVLVDAFLKLRRMPGTENAHLHVAGWLGRADRPYLEEQQKKLADADLLKAVEIRGEVDRDEKIRFLQSLDVFSVPTVYRESKGLSILEAMANGTPVVQPAHGSFPEMVEATGGGILVRPEDPQDLAAGLHRMLTDADLRARAGAAGREAVLNRFTSKAMADRTLEIYREIRR